MRHHVAAVLMVLLLASLGTRFMASREPGPPGPAATPSTVARERLTPKAGSSASPLPVRKRSYEPYNYLYSVHGVHMGDGYEEVEAAFGRWSQIRPQARRMPHLTRLIYPGWTVIVEERRGWGVIEIATTSEPVAVAGIGMLRIGASFEEVSRLLGKPKERYGSKTEDREFREYYSGWEHLSLRLRSDRLEEIIVEGGGWRQPGRSLDSPRD